MRQQQSTSRPAGGIRVLEEEEPVGQFESNFIGPCPH